MLPPLPCLYLVLFLNPFQASSPPKPDLDQLLRDIQSGNFNTATVGQVAELGSPRAIPVLEGAFPGSTDQFTKAAIASALVRLGDKDPSYWNALAGFCLGLVQSKAPFWPVYDENGKFVKGKISPDFREWAKQNGVTEDAARSDQLSLYPVEILLLALTGDRRAVPILRDGLSSPNYLVRKQSAAGLALLQDKDSIPQIIRAAQGTPLELRFAVADALVFFDDPRAKAASEELIPNKPLLEERRKRFKDLGPKGVF